MTTVRTANKFYLAGPMRGFDRFNFPAFDAATRELRLYGYEIVSPAEMDRVLGFDETTDGPEKFEELGGIEAAMHRDFSVILACDGVILLPGWRQSSGARAEVYIAQTTGRGVYEYIVREGGGFWLDRVADTGVLRLHHNAMPTATIIGLSGYAQTGKDTVGTYLTDEYGFERISFADALREMLYALDPLTWVKQSPSTVDRERSSSAYYRHDEVHAIVDRHGWEWAKAHTGVRQLLQRLGTEAGRNVLGDDIWVRTAMAKVKPGGRYVFTDCRFPNEAEEVRAAGGSLVRIERPGYRPINAHPSETSLDDWTFDGYVLNDGSLTDLACEVERVVVGQVGRQRHLPPEACQTRQVR